MTGGALICDIGGTNARFAVADAKGVARAMQILAVADYPRFTDALAAYLAQTGFTPTSAAIAAAGPVADDAIRLTNAPWTIRAADISQMLGGISVDVFNDLEAVAFALPHLRDGDVETLHPVTPERGTSRHQALPLLALNVGTGFGAAVAVPTAEGWCALATEAGHTHLDASGLTEDAVTVEDVFSGHGFRRFLPPNAADLIERRTAYSRLFGRVVRDMILATGTWGGVYLCGGVLTDFKRNLSPTSFLEGLLSPGPMAPRIRAVPIRRVTIEAPALRGLAARVAT